MGARDSAVEFASLILDCTDTTCDSLARLRIDARDLFDVSFSTEDDLSLDDCSSTDTDTDVDDDDDAQHQKLMFIDDAVTLAQRRVSCNMQRERLLRLMSQYSSSSAAIAATLASPLPSSSSESPHAAPSTSASGPPAPSSPTLTKARSVGSGLTAALPSAPPTNAVAAPPNRHSRATSIANEAECSSAWNSPTLVRRTRTNTLLADASHRRLSVVDRDASPPTTTTDSDGTTEAASTASVSSPNLSALTERAETPPLTKTRSATLWMPARSRSNTPTVPTPALLPPQQGAGLLRARSPSPALASRHSAYRSVSSPSLAANLMRPSLNMIDTAALKLLGRIRAVSHHDTLGVRWRGTWTQDRPSSPSTPSSDIAGASSPATPQRDRAVSVKVYRGIVAEVTDEQFIATVSHEASELSYACQLITHSTDHSTDHSLFTHTHTHEGPFEIPTWCRSLARALTVRISRACGSGSMGAPCTRSCAPRVSRTRRCLTIRSHSRCWSTLRSKWPRRWRTCTITTCSTNRSRPTTY